MAQIYNSCKYYRKTIQSEELNPSCLSFTCKGKKCPLSTFSINQVTTHSMSVSLEYREIMKWGVSCRIKTSTVFMGLF